MTRNRKQRPVRMILLVIILVGVCGVLVFSVVRLYPKQQSAKENHMQYQERYDQLVEQKQQLDSELDALDSSRGIEAELRARYDIAREGEEVITVIENEESSNTQEIKE